MSQTLARNILAAMWGAFFLAALLLPLGMYATGWLGEEWFGKLLTQVNRTYVPYVGALLSFYLAARAEERKTIPVSATVVAVVCAAAWNALNLFFLVALCEARVTHIDAKAALDGMDRYSSMLSWVVAPAMGFFFGSHIKASRKQATAGVGAHFAKENGR